jgi:hypothetical protein
VPAGGRLAELAEVREKISEMMAAHWEHWVSQPLPGNPTPMDAVKDPDGREIVESLVLQGERLGPRAAWLASAFCQGQTNVLLTARMPTGRSWSVFALAAAVGPCVVLPHLGPRHLAPAPALFLENGKSLNDLGRTGVAIAITFACRRRHDLGGRVPVSTGGTGERAKTGTCSWGRAIPAYYLGGAECLTRLSSRGLPGDPVFVRASRLPRRPRLSRLSQNDLNPPTHMAGENVRSAPMPYAVAATFLVLNRPGVGHPVCAASERLRLSGAITGRRDSAE